MNSTLSSKIGKHFIAMGAVAAALAGTQTASAALVHSGIVNIPIPVTLDGIYLNLVTGATGGTGGTTAGWDINPWSATSLSLFFPTTPAASHGAVANAAGGTSATTTDNLPSGFIIDGTSAYTTSTGVTDTGLPLVLNSSNNLIGFRFFNEATSSINFGWMRMSIGTSLTDPARAIVEYAYDDSGAAVAAGVVPAPASAALLGLGGLAVARRRRH